MFFSSVFFNQEIYPIEGEEKEEIVESMGGKATEMLGYYNSNDTENFCKYCTNNLSTQLASDTSVITNVKDEYGEYTKVGEVDIKKIANVYYVQYPVFFENLETQHYFILLLSDIDINHIYGFLMSPDKN